MTPVRCVHCGIPHDPRLAICPATGLAMPAHAAAWTERPAAGAPIPPAPVVPRAHDGQGAPPERTPAARRAIIGRVIGDKYGVTGLIGEGGMGAVYEAEHLQIGRLVAVKVLHPKHAQKREAISRLHHEARVVGTVGHPNICEVYDIGRLDDGSPYLVMERLFGETLSERIQRDGAVPAVELIDIMVQVLSALAAAHDKGIIHRDLKPDNIFLSARPGMPPVAKLLDFGISKASNIDDTAVNLTRTGMVMGTPYYMAPEQARGERALDLRVDLWAVGVILYEALTGRRPFVARNYNALLVQILTSRHRAVQELNASVPPALSAIVDKALSKMREDRFQAALEFQQALLELRRALAPGPSVPGPSTAGVSYGRRATDRAPSAASPRVRDPLPRARPTPMTASPARAPSAARGAPAASPTAAPRAEAVHPKLQLGPDERTYVMGPLPDSPVGAAHVDDSAPIHPTGEDEDVERTIIDPPSFLTDSVTVVRRDLKKPEK